MRSADSAHWTGAAMTHALILRKQRDFEHVLIHQRLNALSSSFFRFAGAPGDQSNAAPRPSFKL